MSDDGKPQVFKVQVSYDGGSYLIYNKSESLLYQGPLTKEISKLVKPGEKGYFLGAWHKKTGRITIEPKRQSASW